MVDCFLVKYFCTKSDDRPGQEVKNFFDCFYPPIFSGDPAGYVVMIHKCAL